MSRLEIPAQTFPPIEVPRAGQYEPLSMCALVNEWAVGNAGRV